MEKMILQQYVDYRLDDNFCIDMYLKTTINSKIIYDKDHIILNSGNDLNFDTYFNSFSINKWRRYTNVEKVDLDIEFKGHFRLRVFNVYLHSDILRRDILFRADITSEEKGVFTYNFDKNYDGYVYFELVSLDDNSIFYNYNYSTELSEDLINDIKLAINICTFKREDYVKSNVNYLKTAYLENEKSPLYDNLHVFITDNGQTLEDTVSGRNVVVNKNKNTGGAGGFTRGLMEVKGSNLGITNVIMMDDDVKIPSSAIEKLYNFLKVLKPQYKMSHIGGAMLRTDFPNIQYESGANFVNGSFLAQKQNYNLIDSYFIAKNEVVEKIDYFAWWFNCFSVDHINEDNLPLPLFIKGDDAEYTLRNVCDGITLNGICLWHEPFEYKYTSHLEYFTTRNTLAVTTLRHGSIRGVLNSTFKRFIKNLIFYKYNYNINLMNGLEDYLKGPSFIMETDPIDILKSQTAFNYKAVSLEELEIPFNINNVEMATHSWSNRRDKIKRLITINGYLLKANRQATIFDNYAHRSYRPMNLYRVKKVLYVDTKYETGYVLERNTSLMLKQTFKFINLYFKAMSKKNKLSEEYLKSHAFMTSKEFWNKYLGLGE